MTVVGPSMMTHYGSYLVDWWNDAFQELRDNGHYERLCQRAQSAHGRNNYHINVLSIEGL